MKKEYLNLIVVLILISVTGCSSNAEQTNIENLSSIDREINIDKLEIYHFHGTNQCYSCITVGDYAEATVNTYFVEELKSGIIVFDHINGDLSANRNLVMKYGATGSSLWLGTYNGNDFNAEENVNVWYKIRDKQAYMNYLKEVIEQKLVGN